MHAISGPETLRTGAARGLAALIALGASAVAWTCGHDAALTATATRHASTPEEPLLWALRATLALVVAWLAAIFALEAVAGLPGILGRTAGALRSALGPWGGGAVVSLVLGVLVSPVAAHAGSAPDPLDLPATTVSTTAGPQQEASRAPGRVVDAEALEARSGDQAHPAPGSGSPDHERPVVVRPGDTLWDIAARHLGPHASATAVAQAWPRWYAANQEVIGEDPDRVLPGMTLRAPDSAEDAR